jgi:hypothetical protein
MKFLGKAPTLPAEEWERAAARMKMAKDMGESFPNPEFANPDFLKG